MTGPHRSPTGPSPRPRRGFSILEVQAAFVVLGLGVAALVPFAVAQLRLVTALERRLPPNATYALISKDHGLVSLLAAGGSGSPTSAGTTSNTTAAIPTSRAIAIDQVQPAGTGPMDLTATVTVKQPASTSTSTSGGS
jgi:Tfp pilus assembly protein PilV